MSKTTPPKARQAKKKSSVSTAQGANEAPLLPRETEHVAKKKRLPSQFELASLAAAIDSPNNTPDATAKRALAVWKACGKELTFEAAREEFASIREERLAHLGFGQRVLLDKVEVKPNGSFIFKLEEEPLPLLDFLKPHFSKNSKPAHMIKKFRDFLCEETENLEDDEETSFHRVAQSMKEYREYGVPSFVAADLSLNFVMFLKRQKEEIKVERARKGGIARKEKAEAAAGKERGEKKTLGNKKPGPKQKKARRKQ